MTPATHQHLPQNETFDGFAQARAEQGYRGKAASCRDCKQVKFDIKENAGARPWNQYELVVSRTNPRCGIGGFSVLLTGSCSKHEPK
jgi:hypothetical protein